MKRVYLLPALLSVLMLVSCGKTQANCSDAASQAALDTAIRESLIKIVLGQGKGEDGKSMIGGSAVRAAIANLKLVIENVRTTKEDPNSTKRFCTGNLKIVFGTKVFADADRTRELAGMPDLSSAADSANVEKGADYLKGDLDYSVQPTDDGSKIVAEFDSDKGKLGIFGEVVAASLLKSTVENKKRIDDENAALVKKQVQDAVSAANQASIEQAMVGLKSAESGLTEVWRALAPGTRQQLLPEQRAWIKRKDTSCRLQGIQGSTDPTEQRVITLNCVASESRSRASELQSYLGNND